MTRRGRYRRNGDPLVLVVSQDDVGEVIIAFDKSMIFSEPHPAGVLVYGPPAQTDIGSWDHLLRTAAKAMDIGETRTKGATGPGPLTIQNVASIATNTGVFCYPTSGGMWKYMLLSAMTWAKHVSAGDPDGRGPRFWLDVFKAEATGCESGAPFLLNVRLR